MIDQLNTVIKSYLTSIDPDELGPHDHHRLQEGLSFTMILGKPAMSSIRYLLPHTSKGLKRGLALPKEGQAELLSLMERLMANLRMLRRCS